jgi:hypothetical protein
MTDGYEVDPVVLTEVATILRDVGEALDTAGREAPGVPDAGPVSGDMGALMAHLAAAAGELVVGAGAAGDQVAKGGRTYAETEDSARRGFTSTGD